jgi:ADP-ribose pyrophosphatase YjhB (NUDIX family)
MNAGTDALVVDDDGRVLLVRRADDRCWAMPGGWVDADESAERAVVREVLEETGLEVIPLRLLESTRRPASVHHTYECRVVGGRLRRSDESIEVGFVDPDRVSVWHADHQQRLSDALAARRYHRPG